VSARLTCAKKGRCSNEVLILHNTHTAARAGLPRLSGGSPAAPRRLPGDSAAAWRLPLSRGAASERKRSARRVTQTRSEMHSERSPVLRANAFPCLSPATPFFSVDGFCDSGHNASLGEERACLRKKNKNKSMKRMSLDIMVEIPR